MGLSWNMHPRFFVKCEKCNRPVDWLEWNYNVLTRTYEVALACHGQSYVKSIGSSEIESAPGRALLVLAFTEEDGFPNKPTTTCRRVLAL